MKKYLKIVILFVLLFLTNVKAFSVENETIYIEAGTKKGIHLYADTEEEVQTIKMQLTYSTNDLKGTDFTPSNGVKDEYDGKTKHILKLKNPASGKIDLGTINIKAVNEPSDIGGTITVTEFDGNALKLKKLTILIRFGESEGSEETTEPVIDTTSSSLLSRIESNLVNIELKKNVFEYEVTVPADTIELDLNPIAINKDVRVTISSQEINNLENNAVIITLENGKITQQYKINVKVKKAVKETQIDNTTEVKEYHYKWKYLVVIGLCIAGIFGILSFKLPKGD